jgi:hypothetical protein
MATKHPEICVTVEAFVDDYRVIDHVIKAMRRAGLAAEEIEEFCDEPVRTVRCFGFAAAGSRWCRTEALRFGDLQISAGWPRWQPYALTIRSS